jgi:hypothetical protein
VQIKQQLLDSKALSVAFEAKKVVASYPSTANFTRKQWKK